MVVITVVVRMCTRVRMCLHERKDDAFYLSRPSLCKIKNKKKGLCVCWLVGCLTSLQHASVFQGRMCSDNFTCSHTEIEVADQTFSTHPVTVY